MSIHLAWSAIALRLVLSALASAAIGINRGEKDRPVGLRTTMLVTLAAAISMIQVNLLLPVGGKTGDSFVVMDLMRLPLGVLSGMGFIGAGAIIRRGDLVQGVTTAATLWFATVMGLCFGGGQISLGLAALGLAIVVLWPLKWGEEWIGRERRGELSITTTADHTVDEMIRTRFAAAGFKIGEPAISFGDHGASCTWRCAVRWHEGRPAVSPLDIARGLSRHPGIAALEWKPLDPQ